MRSQEITIVKAKESLKQNLTYFMDIVDSSDASEAILNLLLEADDEQLTPEQRKAVNGVLSVLGSITRLQLAERCNQGFTHHILKIA